MKMEKMVIKLMVVSLFVLMSAGAAFSADASFGADFNSAYVWRGVTFNDGFVMQPSIDVSKGGFGVNVWGNYDFDDYDGAVDDNQFQEIDLTISYGLSVDMVELSFGYIEYTFPSAGGEAAREIFASAWVSPIEGLSAGVDVYYEVDLVEDYYISLGIGYELSVNDALGVSCGASIGINGEDYAAVNGGTDGGLNEYTLSLSASYAVIEAVSVGVNLVYTDAIDDDVLPDAACDTNFIGGLSVYYDF